MSQYQHVAILLLALSPEGTTIQVMPVPCCSEQCFAVYLLQYENTVSKTNASLNAQKAACPYAHDGHCNIHTQCAHNTGAECVRAATVVGKAQSSRKSCSVQTTTTTAAAAAAAAASTCNIKAAATVAQMHTDHLSPHALHSIPPSNTLLRPSRELSWCQAIFIND